MNFRIADTFTDSLARLTGEEQKAVKTTAFDLQINPANPGMSFHKLDMARDKNFWSVRVSGDIRLIVHRTADSLLLCYVDHHDKAYDWAERRKLETHPKTGAAQLVEIRETVQEIVVPRYTEAPKRVAAKKPLFAKLSEDDLLGYGVPGEWLNDVRRVTEDTLLALADHLPGEAAEALLELATGGKPRASQPVVAVASPLDHPDAQRRFRVMSNIEELERALEFPWDKWTVFLHPEQRQCVEREYGGPARVSGSAGTGKTIVALHRAVFLARSHPDARVLLTTFSDTLANALRTRLKRLVSHEPRLAERLDVHSINAIGSRLYKSHFGQANLATRDVILELIGEASKEVVSHKFSLQFLYTEWDRVVDAWQLDSWEAYRDVVRLGRRTRLPEQQRAVLWSISDRVRAGLAARNLITHAGMSHPVGPGSGQEQEPALRLHGRGRSPGHQHVALAILCCSRCESPRRALLCRGPRPADLPAAVLLESVGCRYPRAIPDPPRQLPDLATRSARRPTRLLGPQVSDVDGNTEERRDTVSVFNGPAPAIRILKSQKEEIKTVSAWLSIQLKAGVVPHEFGVFVRSTTELPRARAAVQEAGIPFKILDEHVEDNQRLRFDRHHASGQGPGIPRSGGDGL